MKTRLNNELSLYPCPTVLVTSKLESIENVLTVSWAGIASSHPEYVSIAINLKRYSHFLIENSKKFCINIPNSNIIEQVDCCGNLSGKNINKFDFCKFDKIYYQSDYILIEQCPVHLVCDVTQMINLGSHDLFIARITDKLMDTDIEYIHNEIDPIVYFRPNYYRINKDSLGFYGYSKQKLDSEKS